MVDELDELQLHFEGPGADEAALRTAEDLESLAGVSLRMVRSRNNPGETVRGVSPEVVLVVTLIVSLPGAANHLLQLVDRLRGRPRVGAADGAPQLSVEVGGGTPIPASLDALPGIQAALESITRGEAPAAEDTRSWQERLGRLLESVFTADELRMFIHRHPAGDHLWARLPAASSLELLCEETVRLLEREGLVDSDLFRRLVESRPGRASDIEAVARATLTRSP